MGQPAAKMGDKVVALDTHIYLIPSPAGPIPTPLPSPFSGVLQLGLSTNVMIEGKPAATVDSIAVNLPPHILQGGPFQKPPANQGKIIIGSGTVKINGKMAARMGDTAMTCNDPTDLPIGKVVLAGPCKVLIGG
ncbi:MAG: PAAR domain-containing protein [Chloroflexota bacterium]|nr:PAAR domain-containing protein [Chloroflexota bacterium]